MQIFSLGIGIGDVLLSTAVIHAWTRKHEHRLPVLTFYPEIFLHNRDILFSINTARYREFIEKLNGPLIWRIGNCLQIFFQQVSIGPSYPFPCWRRHVLDAMAESMGVTLSPSEREPVLYLTEKEKQAQSWAAGWIALQSCSSSYWTVNKDWVAGHMREVVQKLVRTGQKVVHIGKREDTMLTDVVDLRGKTTLRETAAILANARLFVGMEGGLVHLARAVGRKSVVVYTGYTTPAETGYPDNLNLRDPKAGEGCWRRDRCEHCVESARAVSPDMVVESTLSLLAGRASPTMKHA